MSPTFPFIRATLYGALVLSPALVFAQTSDTRPPQATSAPIGQQPAPMAQPMMPPGAMPMTPAPVAPRPATPTRASSDQRTSKIVGSDVMNEAGVSIGSIDDLIVGSGSAGMTAVISVGGFLGIGARLVTVPFAELRYNTQTSRWTLPGATRDSLTARPAFTY